MTEGRDAAAHAELVAYIQERTGITIADALRHRLEDGIAAAQRVTGCATKASLAARIRIDADAFEALVGEVVVGETYLFRDRRQLETMRREALRTLASRGPLRVWSAGCATGEEAHTLSIMLSEERLPGSVLGSDLSRSALATAERGVYRPWSLRALRDHERMRWFTQEDDGLKLRRPFRERVRFQQHNLLDPAPADGVFDVILCRNVLIYMSPDAVRIVAERLRDALAPGGWLFTAATDPPLDVGGLDRVTVAGGSAYRRSPVEEPMRAARAARPVPAPTAPRRPLVSPRPSPGSRPDDDHQSVSVAAHARKLADSGRHDEAFAMVRAGCDERPDDAELRFIAALLELHAGRVDAAAEALAAARFLAPDLAAVHLLLGRVEAARGRSDEALRSLRVARRLLEVLPADAPVPLIGEPAGRLVATVAERSTEEGGNGR